MTFPDATALLIAYLGPLVTPISVHSKVPPNRPDRFVQVRRVGGGTLTVRDRARLDVFAWDADSEADAMSLLLDVRGHVWALAGTTLLDGVTCYRVQEFLSPRQLDDPASGTPRAWMTVQLDLRADQLIHFAPAPQDES